MLLIFIDGFGIEKPSRNNLISISKTRNLDFLVSNYETKILNTKKTSNENYFAIGTGDREMEKKDLINKEIDNLSFYKNKDLEKIFTEIKKERRTLNLVVLISDIGKESLMKHFYALYEFAIKKQIKKINIHIVLDGLDTKKDDAKEQIKEFKKQLFLLGKGEIMTIAGRFYAMDRYGYFDKIEEYYNALIFGECENTFISEQSYINKNYKEEIYDRDIKPAIKKDYKGLKKGDALIFCNFNNTFFQIRKAFEDEEFDNFYIKKDQNLKLYFLSDYESDNKNDPVLDYFSRNNKKCLVVGDTYNFTKLTYYLNGKKEEKPVNQDRILIPISKTKKYSYENTINTTVNRIIKESKNDEYDIYITSLGLVDFMENEKNNRKIINSIEYLDKKIKELIDTFLEKNEEIFIISALGRFENMSSFKVNRKTPLILIGEKYKKETNISSLNMLYTQDEYYDISEIYEVLCES
ncbi:hypothetical protein K9M42_03360 [Patescibacteria group bacterium]|nr:hypothetical protein [Patescibacteria group bacterium]